MNKVEWKEDGNDYRLHDQPCGSQWQVEIKLKWADDSPCKPEWGLNHHIGSHEALCLRSHDALLEALTGLLKFVHERRGLFIKNKMAIFYFDDAIAPAEAAIAGATP